MREGEGRIERRRKEVREGKRRSERKESNRRKKEGLREGGKD